jgi:hypothetical protein
VHRFFVNVQHVLTPKLTSSASLVWEPSTLQGRTGVSPNRRETNTKLGTALVYRPGAGDLSLMATIDVDRVHSEVVGRGLKRERYGVSARWAF